MRGTGRKISNRSISITRRGRCGLDRVERKAVSPRFAAIDFETADYGEDSACAVGVVVVEDGRITRREYRLIRPPRSTFVFTDLHGIAWQDVAEEPEFGVVWREIRALIKNVDFIAAHNASFDRRVLRACCDLAGRRTPAAPFVCTVKLSRRVWDIRPTTLPDVCRKFKLKLKHHDALSDATACARIVMRAVKTGFDPMSLVTTP